ncbi:MAG: ABC transporter substrate-binding protein, partial [Acidimicrobiia bacterium]
MKRPVCSAALLLALLVAAACGQKGETKDTTAAPAPSEQNYTGGGETTTDPGTGATTDSGAAATDSGAAAGQSSPASPGSPGTPAASSGSSTGKPTTAATQAPARSGQAQPGQAASDTPSNPQPGEPVPDNPAPGGGGQPVAPPPNANVDRTGVSDKVIKIGIHAPVTGAAPFPQNAFDKGKDVYWKHVAEKGGVFGRNVEIIFRDDQFNPSRAVQVCREMVEQEKVFALIGAAGSEQITACARYAASAGVPFLSGGVNEEGLAGLNTYFAVSQTYSQQAPLLAQLAKNKIGKSKIAIVINNTPALNETQKSMTAAAEAAGLDVVRNSRIGKNASDSELLSEANELRTSGAEIVNILTSPVNFIKLATNAQAQAYNPIYIGPGVTNGLNIVAEAGCPAIGAAKFLSPFPQLDAIDKLDPDYKPAYAKYAGGEADDIGLAEWGLNKVLHRMLEATGQDLSRESFLSTLTSGKEFNSNVYPSVSYTGSIRFGAKTMHLLEADCSARKYKTLATF